MSGSHAANTVEHSQVNPDTSASISHWLLATPAKVTLSLRESLKTADGFMPKALRSLGNKSFPEGRSGQCIFMSISAEDGASGNSNS